MFSEKDLIYLAAIGLYSSNKCYKNSEDDVAEKEMDRCVKAATAMYKKVFEGV